MGLNKEEYEFLGEALSNARKSFEETLEDKGVDAAYYSIDITLRCWNSMLSDVLHIIKDLDYSTKQNGVGKNE